MTAIADAPDAEVFLNGKILLIDKPFGWTSFDVVKKIRNQIQRRYGLKKLKVGHAGTLDPLATGLLVLCTGKATKLISELTIADKAYTGTFRLGATTPSYDLETEVSETLPTLHITPAMVAQAAAKLSGEQQQVPPQYSAKQVDGKRAYDSARKGEEVKLAPNRVHISKFETDCSKLPDVRFAIVCTKGTYIRSIARDLGELLGCGAHLTELRRTFSGEYNVDDAKSPEEFSLWLGDEISTKSTY
jgi:tRNA pseudouridine55 synthase